MKSKSKLDLAAARELSDDYTHGLSNYDRAALKYVLDLVNAMALEIAANCEPVSDVIARFSRGLK